jgi:hypothetical protein
VEGEYGDSELSAQFCCELKNALKINSSKNKYDE